MRSASCWLRAADSVSVSNVWREATRSVWRSSVTTVRPRAEMLRSVSPPEVRMRAGVVAVVTPSKCCDEWAVPRR